MLLKTVNNNYDCKVGTICPANFFPVHYNNLPDDKAKCAYFFSRRLKALAQPACLTAAVLTN